jgi:hypothetical protein
LPGQPLALCTNFARILSVPVTLPDGRQYTPCAQCFLKFNPDAFVAPILTTANGTQQVDLYWMGNQAINYGAMRGPGRNNIDLTLTRDFRVTERFSASFMANVTNALTTPNSGLARTTWPWAARR